MADPERGFLCIGGPLDGQWLSLSDEYNNAATHRFPLMLPMRAYDAAGRQDPVMFAPGAVRDIVYERTRFHLGEHGPAVDVLLVRGFDPGDVLMRLLENYRPKGDHRG